MSLFKKIKSFFWFVFFMLFGLAIMLYFSLSGEKEHLKQCKNLGIKCEEGQMHQTVSAAEKWLYDLVENIKQSKYFEDKKK